MDKIIDILKKILKKDLINLSDNFFLIGGNSIKALILISEIQKEFNIIIMITDIYEQKTIADIISIVERKITKTQDYIYNNGRIIHFNKINKDRYNLFLLPPILGTSIVYNEIASKLSSSFNLIGLEYPGFHNADEMVNDLQSIVSCHLREIREIQDQGLYFILGYSMGALIAFELAKKIEEDLKNSVKLFLVDSVPKILGYEKYLSEKNLEMDSDNNIKNLAEVYKDILDVNKITHYQMVIENNIDIFDKYQISGIIKGDIIAFKAKESYGDMFKWSNYTQGVFTHKLIDATHSTIINNMDISSLLIQLD